MSNCMERLNEIFQEVFDDDTLQLTHETTANDVEGWDSLSHINLIVAVESAFNIRFSQKELLCLKKVGDLLDLVEAKST